MSPWAHIRAFAVPYGKSAIVRSRSKVKNSGNNFRQKSGVDTGLFCNVTGKRKGKRWCFCEITKKVHVQNFPNISPGVDVTRIKTQIQTVLTNHRDLSALSAAENARWLVKSARLNLKLHFKSCNIGPGLQFGLKLQIGKQPFSKLPEFEINWSKQKLQKYMGGFWTISRCLFYFQTHNNKHVCIMCRNLLPKLHCVSTFGNGGTKCKKPPSNPKILKEEAIQLTSNYTNLRAEYWKPWLLKRTTELI